MSASQSSEKLEKEKAKKKEKKERKDKDRAERDVKDKENNIEERDEGESTTGHPKAGSGNSTPAPDASTADVSKSSENELKSPVTESAGVRTPTGRRPARNPWTLFMKMVVPVTEIEVKEFFGEAQSGVRHLMHSRVSSIIHHLPMQITRVTCPAPIPGRSFRIAYVEFGDEEAMKAGLDKHAEVCVARASDDSTFFTFSTRL